MPLVFTQFDCEEYLKEIERLQIHHDFRSSVDKVYIAHTWTYSDSENKWINPVIASGEGSSYDGPGATGWFPAWRTANPSATEITSEAEETTNPDFAAWAQWNQFTNHRADYDAATVTLAADIVLMQTTHTEMLATVV